MSRATDGSGLRFLYALSIALIPAFAIAQEPSSPDQTWIDRALLERGGIQFDFGDDSGFRGVVRAAATIDAPALQVWEILVDCEAAPTYLDNVQSCDLVETLDDGRAQIFRQRAKLRWFLPSVEHEFRMDYVPYDRITVSRVSGPFDRLDAVWWLIRESDTRTRIIYRLDLDPGVLIPNFLLTKPLRRDIVTALRAVRERATER